MADEVPTGGATPLTADAAPDKAAAAGVTPLTAPDKAAADKAAADKIAADKAATNQTPAEKAAAEKAAADKAAAEKVPDKYEAFKLPEGMNLDPAEADKFSAVAKELGLTQAAAQKLVDFETARMEQFAKAHVDAWKKTTDDWLASAKADKEIGGAGYDAALAVAKRSIAKYASPEYKKLLDTLGVGNHPEVIRYHYRVGKELSEDGILAGQTSAAPKSLADRIFPPAG